MDVRYDGAVLTRSGVIQSMYEYDISELQTSDFKLHPVDQDAAILMYKVTVKATQKGQPLPDLITQASTLYVLSGGKWLIQFHQETALPPAPQTQTAPAR